MVALKVLPSSQAAQTFSDTYYVWAACAIVRPVLTLSSSDGPIESIWVGVSLKLSFTAVKGAVSGNSAKLGNYKMPVKLRET